jgi:hypothetical protein
VYRYLAQVVVLESLPPVSALALRLLQAATQALQGE